MSRRLGLALCAVPLDEQQRETADEAADDDADCARAGGGEAGRSHLLLRGTEAWVGQDGAEDGVHGAAAQLAYRGARPRRGRGADPLVGTEGTHTGR